MSKSMIRVVSVGAVLAAAVALAGWSQAGEAQASFKGTGPGGFKIEGTTKSVTVKDSGKALTVDVKLTDLDTGISLRNKHMLEDIEAEKFPVASLTVSQEALKVPDDGKSFDGEAKGTFAMHGKTKEVPFKYTATCKGGTCDVEGSADLNLKDYEIKVRSYMGITVKPEISVKTKFQVKK